MCRRFTTKEILLFQVCTKRGSTFMLGIFRSPKIPEFGHPILMALNRRRVGAMVH